jgi:hypothetical protein
VKGGSGSGYGDSGRNEEKRTGLQYILEGVPTKLVEELNVGI